MTRERKNILCGVFIVTVVYVATLWQRPLFAPWEYDFAALSMAGTDSFSALLNGVFGKALSFNTVSVRLMPALCSILCALCVRFCGKTAENENFGNLAAIMYLANFLVFSFGTACSKEMICTLFFTAAATSALAALKNDSLSKARFFLLGAASGCACGFFALSAGYISAAAVPLAAIAGFSAAKKKSLFPVISLVFAAAVCGAWMLKHPLPVMAKTKAFLFSELLWVIPALLPWGLFVFQAAAAVRSKKKEYFSTPLVQLALFVTVCALLSAAFLGTALALLITLPMLTTAFAAALKLSAGDRKLLKISELTLNYVSVAIILFTAATVVLCCLKSVPARWKLYYSKAELAGFAVAVTVALIQFRIAASSNVDSGAKKLLHVATGAAVLMILLPGAVPQRMKNTFAPDEFFRSISARYIPADAEIYADADSIGAVRWILRDRKITLITKKSVHPLAKRIENDLPTAVFSTSGRFTKVLPRTKMLFSRGIWRIVICQTKGTSVYEKNL